MKSPATRDVSRLRELLSRGQSYWMDNLTREMIETGELAHRVTEEGLRGITSNPKTFADSIQLGERYDADVASLAQQGATDEAIYEALMIDDAQRACDVLRPVFEESSGSDGFVSIEVDPRLARQTEATLDAARMLWRRVDRPNVMVKIPGTEQGLPAIEEALFEGIDVNITLLFSSARYRRVVARYLKALDRRRKEGLPIDGIASVASFFLSRIDALVDELLEHRQLPDCPEHTAGMVKGKAALSEAALAYLSFREAFRQPQWNLLRSEGAMAQRPLWASTSVKSDAYPDTLYVDALVAEGTVTTMPEATIEAFADHGRLDSAILAGDRSYPTRVAEQLRALDIDMAQVAQRLEDEGIQKFIEPFADGLKAVSKIADRARRQS